MTSTAALLVLTVAAIMIGVARSRGERAVAAPLATVEDVVVDLEFLRARPAELDQRISELVSMSGRRTLGARMRSVQLAEQARAASTIPVVRTRRRTRPLVASR